MADLGYSGVAGNQSNITQRFVSDIASTQLSIAEKPVSNLQRGSNSDIAQQPLVKQGGLISCRDGTVTHRLGEPKGSLSVNSDTFQKYWLRIQKGISRIVAISAIISRRRVYIY